MPLNVWFADDVIEQAVAVCPSFKFSKFAQSAVREKIDKEKLLQEQIKESVSQ